MALARSGLALGWLAFQFTIIVWPQQPLVERAAHLFFATAVLLATSPSASRWLDGALLAVSLGVGVYFAASAQRLNERVEAVSPVLPVDVVAGTALVVLLLEGVRRAVGWSLLSLLLVAILYGFLGPWFPGWSRFSGFGVEEMVEILSMTTNGVLGVTTETSVQFVFYFLVFGVLYGAVGGGRLFLDIGLRAAGRHRGGAAKAAVVSSALMGMVSGSAVANVVSVGVFTIPLMRRAGYKAEDAAGIEAISSTGGQLMPPVMGVAAFVMAELLQVDYGKIALAAVIPAVAFYLALYLVVDLGARRTGVGVVPASELDGQEPILPRLHLLIPPVLLIGMLAWGRSARMSVVWAILACCLLGVKGWRAAVDEVARQAAQVAVPIAAIGIIIAIAVQSNLALRFSARLVESGGENVYAALAMTVVGCIVLGMGLPTVAAYIVGAVLFVPALQKLGLQALAAHFFVMYYCVLSMVTPPVALASFAAAGLAGTSAMRTGWIAFRLSLVLFLVPFGFAFDLAMLGQGPPITVGLAFASIVFATAAWAVALVGFVRRELAWLERGLAAAVAVAIILLPTGSQGWWGSMAACAVLGGWLLRRM
jgi:TRAP transporter 4TM/12TM fusion protein